MQLRPRMVLPGFWDDYEFCRDVPRPLRLFYLGLWCVADDRGALQDSPPAIKRALFGYDDDITVEQVARWIEDLIDKKKLIRYEAGGKNYLLLVNFLKHQRIPRPARTKCCPLAEDMEFDETRWAWVRIPEHYFRRPRKAQTPPKPSPGGIPDEWLEPDEPEPQPQPETAVPAAERKASNRGPQYTEEERLIVAHFKERLIETGVDYFDRAWHLRQLPAARRLLQNGERTVEDVMLCIDWALRLKREGRLKRNVDHLLAIEELWPRFRLEVGGYARAAEAGDRPGAGVQRQDAGRPDGDGRPAQAGEDRRDYAGGVYGSFFGPAVPGGGPN